MCPVTVNHLTEGNGVNYGDMGVFLQTDSGWSPHLKHLCQPQHPKNLGFRVISWFPAAVSLYSSPTQVIEPTTGNL